MRTELQFLILILVAAVVLITVGLGVWLVTHKMRSQKLSEKFGPEYDYIVEKEGDRRTVEEILQERVKRVTQLDLRTPDENERDRYHGEWIEVQASFVDDPSKSVTEANRLITELMIARGFPVADFEQRAADLSVMYPELVSNYRNAHAIALKNQNGESSTEDLRQAMVYYRSLFEKLLGIVEVQETEEKELVTK